MIKVMVADDEKSVREKITEMISSNPNFEIVGVAENGREVLHQLEHKEPDVLFLDVEMPEMSGIEVASQLAHSANPPWIVFVTGYQKYALDAFENNAIDYVLKPFNAQRLDKALARVMKYDMEKKGVRAKLESFEKEMIDKGVLKKLMGHKRNSKEKIVFSPEDVFYFHSHLRDVTAYLENDGVIMSITLKELIDRLDPHRFMMVHRAYIVNLDKIKKIVPMFAGAVDIILSHSQYKVPGSRKYARLLKKFLRG